MATRPVLKPQAVITDGNMASASVTSDPTILNQLSGLMYQASWTGTSPIGTLSVQFSNDYSLHADGTVNNAGTWTTATLQYQGSASTTIPVTGNTGSSIIDLTHTAAWAARLVYTKTSGVGTIDATVMGKVA